MLAAAMTASSAIWPCRVPAKAEGTEALSVELQIELRVVDLENRPIEGAQLLFLNTGGRPEEKRLLGRTNQGGALKTAVSQEWSDYFREERNPNTGTFDIFVVAPHGATSVRHFAIECLARKGNVYAVTVSASLPNVFIIS